MIIPPGITNIGAGESSDQWGGMVVNNNPQRPSNGRFYISKERPAFASYTFSAYIPASGGYAVASAVVAGRSIGVFKVGLPENPGATGRIQYIGSFSIFVPAGVNLTLSSSTGSGGSVEFYAGQEVIL